jgi:hypothetical protein
MHHKSCSPQLVYGRNQLMEVNNPLPYRVNGTQNATPACFFFCMFNALIIWFHTNINFLNLLTIQVRSYTHVHSYKDRWICIHVVVVMKIIFMFILKRIIHACNWDQICALQTTSRDRNTNSKQTPAWWFIQTINNTIEDPEPFKHAWRFDAFLLISGHYSFPWWCSVPWWNSID